MLNMNDLSQHIILAAPALDDIFFGRSVIYIEHHDNNGAKGYIINQSMGVSMAELFDKLNFPKANIALQKMRDIPVLMGGPEEQSSGQVLYPNVSDNTVTISSSRQIIEKIVENQGPPNFRIVLGCCQWEANQLEQEITQGKWLVTSLSLNLLFDCDLSTCWKNALRHIGIRHTWALTRTTGHA